MYRLTYSDSALKFVRTKVPVKHLKNLGDRIELCLGKYLKTISKRCNKKDIKGTDPVTYRLHVAMKYTVFYIIDDCQCSFNFPQLCSHKNPQKCSS